jgi:hypothetical protein
MNNLHKECIITVAFIQHTTSAYQNVISTLRTMTVHWNKLTTVPKIHRRHNSLTHTYNKLKLTSLKQTTYMLKQGSMTTQLYIQKFYTFII